jgi:D-lactate dehydrogenase
MKIAIFEIEEWERAVFEEMATDHEVRFEEKPLSTDNVEAYCDADVVSTFIYSRLYRDVLACFTNLQLIATRSTGFDHIDLVWCDENSVSVANVPTYGDNTVAEHVFGLLLTISHNLTHAIDRTRKGDFSLQGLRGFDLKGKTIGVIGTGSIGEYVIEIARGFRMDVLAFDVNPRLELAEHLGFEYVGMSTLLGQSDVITLHVPSNKHTHHLLGQEQFDRMKDGVVLINTARGPIVDIQALLGALSSGRVAAAGLDVLPEEPVIREEAELLHSAFHRKHNLETLLADHILLRLRNVYITPHSAFNTTEALERILETTRENIDGFMNGEAVNLVHDPASISS